jgi:hypothetical protein
MTPTDKRCKTCEHWKPAYRTIGECVMEGLVPNAIFWIDRRGSDSRLLTFEDFGCVSYRPIQGHEGGVL